MLSHNRLSLNVYDNISVVHYTNSFFFHKEKVDLKIPERLSRIVICYGKFYISYITNVITKLCDNIEKKWLINEKNNWGLSYTRC